MVHQWCTTSPDHGYHIETQLGLMKDGETKLEPEPEAALNCTAEQVVLDFCWFTVNYCAKLFPFFVKCLQYTVHSLYVSVHIIMLHYSVF